MRKKLSATFIALTAGALLIGPVTGAAVAAPSNALPAQQDNDWGGHNNPGWHDPHDPFRNDWHCDRHGFWHNDQHDGWGHRDQRCHRW